MTRRFVIASSFIVAQFAIACSGNVSSSTQPDAATASTNASTGSSPSTSGNGATTAASVAATTADPTAATNGSGNATTGSTDTSGSTNGTTGAAGSGDGGAGGSDLATGSTTTGVNEPTPDCDGACSPCTEGERRYACGYACVCELTEDPARDAEDELLSCNWAEPCETATIAISANAGSPITTMTESECLLSALRDRTPGLFNLVYDQYAGFFVSHAEYVFVLDGSDQVVVSNSGYSGGPGSNVSRTFSPMSSCTLKEAAFFEACLAAPGSCTTVSDFYDDCVSVAPPSCPAD